MNQLYARRIIFVSILFTPYIYGLLLVILIIMKDQPLINYITPLAIFGATVFISTFLSVLYIRPLWSIEFDNPQAQLSHAIVRLAIYHVLPLLGLVYVLLQFNTLLEILFGV